MVKLGFGAMRLPLKDGEIDFNEVSAMVDEFMAAGFNYFDTAHGYLDGKSETAIRKCLVERYPRESFILTNKLTGSFFKKEGGIRPVFEAQLKECGTTYFDWYLMHSQTALNYSKFKRCKAYETALELKEEGKIKHFGISFHDSSEVLEQILTAYPQIEAVQLQFNYLDYDDPAIQAGACYEVCKKFGKKVFVMEPLKGGRLVTYPKDLHNELSPIELALRFICGFEKVEYLLSGMGSTDQVKQNCQIMSQLKPLSKQEAEFKDAVIKTIREENLVQCTACRYCVAGCPSRIQIPQLIACLNSKKIFGGEHYDFYYSFVHTVNSGKASSCVGCGQCEAICPQHLKIRDLMKTAAETFEKAEN